MCSPLVTLEADVPPICLVPTVCFSECFFYVCYSLESQHAIPSPKGISCPRPQPATSKGSPVTPLLSISHPHFHVGALHSFLNFTVSAVSQAQNPITSHVFAHPVIYLLALGGCNAPGTIVREKHKHDTMNILERENQ